jgi:DNA-binding Lrp family transcriptional regulator
MKPAVVSTVRIAMSRQGKNPYQEGHLFVAAIRILEHQSSSPPALKEIAELLGFSTEQAGLISRRLEDHGIVKIVESAFGDRWDVDDHLKLEELAQASTVDQMDEALEQFKAEKSKMAQKIESIKEQQARKQKDLFSELEKQLKKNLADDKP